MLRRIALSGLLAVGLTGAMASTQGAQAAVVQPDTGIAALQTTDTAATPIQYYFGGYPYYRPRYYRPYYYQQEYYPRRHYYRKYYRPRYNYPPPGYNPNRLKLKDDPYRDY